MLLIVVDILDELLDDNDGLFTTCLQVLCVQSEEKQLLSVEIGHVFMREKMVGQQKSNRYSVPDRPSRFSFFKGIHIINTDTQYKMMKISM